MASRFSLVLAASALIGCASPPTPEAARHGSTGSVAELHGHWLQALVELEEHEPYVDRHAAESATGMLVSRMRALLSFQLIDYELVYSGGDTATLTHWPHLETKEWPEELKPEQESLLDELRTLAGRGLPDREDRSDADWDRAIQEQIDQLELLQDSWSGPPTRRFSIESPEPASTQLTIAAREGDAERLLLVALHAADNGQREPASGSASRRERARRRDRLELAGLRLDRALSLGKAAPTAELAANLDQARTRVIESLGADFRDHEQLLAALEEARAGQIAAVESRLLIEAVIREALALRAEVQAALALQPATFAAASITVDAESARTGPRMQRSLRTAGPGSGPSPAESLERTRADWERKSKAALAWLEALALVRSTVDVPDPHHARGSRRVDVLSTLIEELREQSAALEDERADLEGLRARLSAVRRAEREHRNALLRLARVAPVSR